MKKLNFVYGSGGGGTDVLLTHSERAKDEEHDACREVRQRILKAHANIRPKPATARTAAKLVVWIPNTPSAATMTATRTTYFARLEKNLANVASSLDRSNTRAETHACTSLKNPTLQTKALKRPRPLLHSS
ncbi:MAG: hypothetical protein R3B54_18440 [Bdellovibrionota bacterium]